MAPDRKKIVGYHGFQLVTVAHFFLADHSTHRWESSGIPQVMYCIFQHPPAAPQVKIFFDERWPPAGFGSVGAAAW